jgi:hypothetical protein
MVRHRVCQGLRTQKRRAVRVTALRRTFRRVLRFLRPVSSVGMVCETGRVDMVVKSVMECLIQWAPPAGQQRRHAAKPKHACLPVLIAHASTCQCAHSVIELFSSCAASGSCLSIIAALLFARLPSTYTLWGGNAHAPHREASQNNALGAQRKG